jgi:hypothetical protein
MSPTKRIIPVQSAHKDEDIQCDVLMLRIAVVLRRRNPRCLRREIAKSCLLFEN